MHCSSEERSVVHLNTEFSNDRKTSKMLAVSETVTTWRKSLTQPEKFIVQKCQSQLGLLILQHTYTVQHFFLLLDFDFGKDTYRNLTR